MDTNRNSDAILGCFSGFGIADFINADNDFVCIFDAFFERGNNLIHLIIAR